MRSFLVEIIKDKLFQNKDHIYYENKLFHYIFGFEYIISLYPTCDVVLQVRVDTLFQTILRQKKIRY